MPPWSLSPWLDRPPVSVLSSLPHARRSPATSSSGPHMGLASPAVELFVQARGQVLGRFVLKERPSEAGDGLKADVEGAEQREKRLNRTISTFEAAMLAFVAVLAAWSGYAAAKWSTESSLLLATASADRAKANAASLDAVSALNFDTTTFNDWFTAYVGGNSLRLASPRTFGDDLKDIEPKGEKLGSVDRKKVAMNPSWRHRESSPSPRRWSYQLSGPLYAVAFTGRARPGRPIRAARPRERWPRRYHCGCRRSRQSGEAP